MIIIETEKFQKDEICDVPEVSEDGAVATVSIDTGQLVNLSIHPV